MANITDFHAKMKSWITRAIHSILGTCHAGGECANHAAERSDTSDAEELSTLFGQITKSDVDELHAHHVKLESEDWADDTQAFIDGHRDLDCARAARERAEIERTVYHLLRQEALKCERPADYVFETAKDVVRDRIQCVVGDDVVWHQYNKLFADLDL